MTDATKIDQPKFSIGKEQSVRLFETKWREGKSSKEIAEVQLFIAELCMPFNLFQEAVEESLNRPVLLMNQHLAIRGLLQNSWEKRTPNF